MKHQKRKGRALPRQMEREPMKVIDFVNARRERIARTHRVPDYWPTVHCDQPEGAA